MGDLSKYTVEQLEEMRTAASLAAMTDGQLQALRRQAGKAPPGYFGTLKNWVTGADRTEGYPELPDRYIPGVGATAPRMSLGGDDKAKLDIYLKMRREAGIPAKEGEYGFDQRGNAWVIEEGEKFYLNEPGLSGQDAWDIGTISAFTGPRTKFTTSLGAGINYGARLLGASTGAAGGSVLQDVAGINAGSEQGVSRDRAAIAAIFGPTGEILTPLGMKLYQAFKSTPNLIDNATGGLTARGEATVKLAGLNPADVTSDVVRELEKRATGAANPQAASAVAEANTLPVQVPLTKGMQTLDASDQLFENNAMAGAFGDTAQGIVKQGQENSVNALRANVEAIRNQINPSHQAGSAVDAGAAAQSRLASLNQGAKDSVDDAYTAARASSAGVPNNELPTLAHNVRMGTEISPHVAPITHNVINTLEETAGSSGDTLVSKLFEARADLTALRGQAGPEAAAAGNAVRSLDAEISRIMDDGLMAGDDVAVGLWRTAIKRASKRFKVYADGDIVEKLTAKTSPGSSTLKVAPDRAINLIFGRGSVFNPGVAARDMRKMKLVLGANSPEWQQLREAAWMRLSEKAMGGVQANGERILNGGAFAKSLNKELDDNFGVMRQLFDESETALFRKFSRVLSRVTTPTQGGKNFSNTAPALANIIKTLMGAVFVSNGAAARWIALPAVNVAYKASMAGKAANAASGTVAKDISKGLGVGGSTAAIGANALNVENY